MSSSKQIKKINLRTSNNDDHQAILNFLRQNFFPYEPLNLGHRLKNIGNEEDERKMMAEINNGCSFVAIDEETMELAGVLITMPIDANISKTEEKIEYPADPKYRDIWRIMNRVEKESDIFNRYKVTKRLHIHVVAVATNYRGYALGKRLMAKCLEIGKQQGYPVISVDCTSIHTIRIAEQLNMECVNTLAYDEFLDEQGQVIFRPPDGNQYLKTFCKL